jgi:hypothetical protein
MSKPSFILRSLPVAVVMSALACASAAAATHSFVVEGTEISKGAKVEVRYMTDGGTKLEGSLGGIKVLIECDDNVGEGNLEEKGKSTGGFKVERCYLYETSSKGKEAVTECSIEPFEFKIKGELVSGSGDTASVEDELKPNEGTKFAEIEIKAKTCTLEGKYKFEGTQICGMPNYDSKRPDHEIDCTDTGSKLKLSTEQANLNSLLTVETSSSAEYTESITENEKRTFKEWFAD